MIDPSAEAQVVGSTWVLLIIGNGFTVMVPLVVMFPQPPVKVTV